MKKSLLLLLGVLLLTGCNAQPVQKHPEPEIDKLPELEDEALPDWENEILYVDHTVAKGNADLNYVNFVDSEGNFYQYSLFSDDYDKAVYDSSWEAFENNLAGLMEVLYNIKDTTEPALTISSENLKNLCWYGTQLDSVTGWKELESMRTICADYQNRVYFHNPDTGELVLFYSDSECIRDDEAAEALLRTKQSIDKQYYQMLLED